jgi:23S rRNA (guanine1835-N2)-methyltransferase
VAAGAAEILVHGERRVRLRRLPLKDGDRLQAWDAADSYLLRHLDDDPGLPTAGPLLLVNDAFGALATVLHDRAPVVWSDSHLSRRALRHNLAANGCDPDGVPFVPATAAPPDGIAVALIKLPRSLAFLRDQLLRLRPRLRPDARVVLGGMIKHTPMAAWRLLEEVIGPTATTPGWRKARLGVARPEPRPDLPAAGPPASYPLPGTDLTLQSLPNVFSRERPDPGTRLLLDHLPRRDDAFTALDLGCGNGILAVALARRCPGARITGIDESYQAVASALRNRDLVPDGATRLAFTVDDEGATVPDASCDLVVCNPPFHQGPATGDLTAWTMFTTARRVLRPGGRFLLVGNRHLGYHAKLQRLFGRVDLVASNRKFVVLSAVRSTSPA